MKPEIRYSAGLAIIYNGQILLARTAGRSEVRSWGIPKGGIEAGEDPIEAAIRETREELGIKVPKGLIDRKQHTITINAQKWGYFKELHWYVVQISSPAQLGLKSLQVPKGQLDLKEISEARFMSLTEALGSVMISQQSIIRSLSAVLEAKQLTMKPLKSYQQFFEHKIQAAVIKMLHEGVRMTSYTGSELITESSKYPELKRLLDEAEKAGKTLLIAEFVPEIEALVDKFGKSGQSGFSAPFTAGAIVDTIKKMFAREPLGEGITGADDEWNDVSHMEDVQEGTGSFQNNRLSSVFKKGKEGRPYFLDAIVFKSVGKDYTFTSGGVAISEGSEETVGSMHYIKKFPFQPKTFTIDVHEKEYRKLKDGSLVEEEGGGWWESWLADPKQLDAVWEYYDKKERNK